MTLPDERTRAVRSAREFLRDLLDAKKTPKVPLDVRRRAYRVLKHFPREYDLDASVEKLPKIWGKIEDDTE